jgi:hypothetical protein
MCSVKTISFTLKHTAVEYGNSMKNVGTEHNRAPFLYFGAIWFEFKVILDVSCQLFSCTKAQNNWSPVTVQSTNSLNLKLHVVQNNHLFQHRILKLLSCA